MQHRLSIAGVLLAALAAAVLGASTLASAEQSAGGPISGSSDAYSLSVPVRDLPAASANASTSSRPRINPRAGTTGNASSASVGALQPDPLIGDPAPGRTPARDLLFNGASNPSACGGCSPPDTIGDVGPNHYIQMVNATKVSIYDKSGTLLTPRFDLGSLWPSGPCTGNAGDPVVLYDELADRWLLSQFATPNHLCFAISKTSNPLGSYHLYTFNVGSFPDYFKVGAWSNGYYVSANESTYTAYAFNRTKMLAGNPTANFVKFTGETNFLLPADVDGSTAPPGGGLFYTFKDNVDHGGVDRIELFRLQPNFSTPANSTFQLVKTFPITPFTYTVCGFFNFNCIRQNGTTQRVDAVSEWPMQRFAYRRFAGRQSLVGNFTVGGGNGEVGAAIRWFELRNLRTGVGGWTLFQEGTQDQGGVHDRFMGSIAMDENGNIALGYSISSSTLFPSIRYATREPGDPPGTLEPEKVLRPGKGSQTGSNRWGDYSAMSVDPVTDCQFWYTNEYYNPSSGSNWKTAVGAFTMPGCT